MSNTDFTTTISVDQTPKEASDAILNIRDWWSQAIEGVTDQLNAEFTYHYKDVHYCKLKLVELVPGQRVVWLVLDNYFKFTKDKSEWIGTKLVFDISRKGNKTEIRLTHEGLVPQYECYEICREAWTNYIEESLYNLVTIGKGKPNPKEEDGFNAQLVEKWKLE
ncbi:MAG: ATPase [Bacteroidetes bacterium]|nr:ATPase [Bacteroidota bacterium]